MSREVSAQADIGALSIRGLGAFTTVLATLSADNVTPMALIQLENLGTKFLVSGKFAEDVKDLLQRCKSVRLERLALSIGWRKNDSASLMAESAGGQAIALLSMYLRNYFNNEDTGVVLSRLCSRLCPKSINLSSTAQLADVADLLAGKVQALGYGNLLAKEATKIYDIYNSLGRQTAPPDLLCVLTEESMVDLLVRISHALCQEDRICRIKGYDSMGHVIGLIKALFCRNMTLVIEGVVIQDVEEAKIRCEIVQSALEEPIRVQVETKISNSQPMRLPIESLGLSEYLAVSGTFFNFKWHGWLASYIRIIFMNYGITCHQNVLQTFATWLVILASGLKIKITVNGSDNGNPTNVMFKSLATMLGPLSRARMCLICEQILLSTPEEAHDDPDIDLQNFVDAIAQQASMIKCTCPADHGPHLWSLGWHYENSRSPRDFRKDCKNHQFWLDIGSILAHGLHSFFIDPGPDVIICPEFKEPPVCIHEEIHGSKVHCVPIDRLHGGITGHPDSIIASSGTSTIYPAILETLEVPSQQSVTWKLVEGHIIHEQRYYRDVHAVTASKRPKAIRSLMDEIRSSHIGVQTGRPTITIREGYNSLDMLCTIQYDRREINLDLMEIITSYMGMHWTTVCPHSTTKPLSPGSKPCIATSVAAPSAARTNRKRVGVVMTHRNPMAQFLSCGYGYQAVLQRECCLDCAVEATDDTYESVIIVG